MDKNNGEKSKKKAFLVRYKIVCCMRKEDEMS